MYFLLRGFLEKKLNLVKTTVEFSDLTYVTTEKISVVVAKY